MKAISLTQPWASLVVLGIKQWETRGKNFKHVGPLAIHAAKAMPKWARELCRQEPWKLALDALGLSSWRELPRGGVIGMATCRGWVPVVKVRNNPKVISPQERLLGNYDEGYRWCGKFTHTVAFPMMIPSRGSLGIFTLDEETWAQVYQAVMAHQDRKRLAEAARETIDAAEDLERAEREPEQQRLFA